MHYYVNNYVIYFYCNFDIDIVICYLASGFASYNSFSRLHFSSWRVSYFESYILDDEKLF